MGNQFDETTQRKAEEYSIDAAHSGFGKPNVAYAYGRNSTRNSMEVMALAIREEATAQSGTNQTLEEAIAAVKSAGDWPLEENGNG